MGCGAMTVSAAVILAGGQGTRLRETVPGVPKPLAPIGGRPFLDHQLDWLASGGIERVVLTAHYLANQIRRFAESQSNRPFTVEVVLEDRALGTGGAVKHAFDEMALSGPVVVVNGDTLYNFDLSALTDAHGQSSCPVTMAIARVLDRARFGTVELIGTAVRGFMPADGVSAPGMVSCGAYIFDSDCMTDAPQGAFSLEADFLPGMAREGRIAACIIDRDDAFLDIGTPQSYAAINALLQNRVCS